LCPVSKAYGQQSTTLSRRAAREQLDRTSVLPVEGKRPRSDSRETGRGRRRESFARFTGSLMADEDPTSQPFARRGVSQSQPERRMPNDQTSRSCGWPERRDDLPPLPERQMSVAHGRLAIRKNAAGAAAACERTIGRTRRKTNTSPYPRHDSQEIARNSL